MAEPETGPGAEALDDEYCISQTMHAQPRAANRGTDTRAAPGTLDPSAPDSRIMLADNRGFIATVVHDTAAYQHASPTIRFIVSRQIADRLERYMLTHWLSTLPYSKHQAFLQRLRRQSSAIDQNLVLAEHIQDLNRITLDGYATFYLLCTEDMSAARAEEVLNRRRNTIYRKLAPLFPSSAAGQYWANPAAAAAEYAARPRKRTADYDACADREHRSEDGEQQGIGLAPGMPRSPYELLGIPRGASAREITAAYRQLAQQYHPDKVAALGPKLRQVAEQEMKEINAAYAFLTAKLRRPH